MPSLAVLITGASSGLGHQALLQLLSRGHRVIAGVRGGEVRLQSLIGTLPAETRERVFAVDLHVDRPETYGLAKRAIAERFDGKLDVLVNNAGYGLFGAVEDQSIEQIRRQLEVNTLGPIELTKALLPEIRAARGRIINVSSVAGFWTMPLYGAYCASKHALEALTEGMYYDLKPSGVQVGLLEPGGIRTNFVGTAKVIAEGKMAASRIQAFVEFLKKVESRLTPAEKTAATLVRLCERKRLPLRTLAGIDAWMVNLFARILPEGLRAWLQELVFRKMVFRE